MCQYISSEISPGSGGPEESRQEVGGSEALLEGDGGRGTQPERTLLYSLLRDPHPAPCFGLTDYQKKF